jgi:hypothetical protein
MKIYTPEEVGTMLHVSPRTVRNWCWRKRLRYRIRRTFDHGALRRQIQIMDNDLKEFIDEWLPPK